MSIIQGIITVRQGKENELDTSKLLPGEFAFATDTHRLFVGTSSVAKEIAFQGEVSGSITDAQIQEAVNKYLEENPIDPGNVTEESIKKALGYTPADESKIPKNTSDLTNNSEFVTKAVTDLANYYLKTETFTRDEINAKLSAIPKFSIQVVSSLPATNISETTVYLLKVNDDAGNLYEEYIYVDSAWEKLGTQRVDLTGYAKKATTLAGYGITDGATKTELENVQNQVVSLGGEVNYIKAEREEVAEKIYEKMTLGNIALIAFNTDQHISYLNDFSGHLDTLYGLRAATELTKMFPFNLFVLGGDAVSATDLEGILREVLIVTEQTNGARCPVVHLAGNHDANQNNMAINNSMMYKSHTAFSVINYPQFVSQGTSATNGYIDDESVSIRYIFVDSAIRVNDDNTVYEYSLSDIREWLTKALNGVPENYKAIVFSHHPLNTDLPQNDSGTAWNNPIECQDILEANYQKIIACINGHTHNQLTEDLHGIRYITTPCAGRGTRDGVSRPTGTANATAFDVFVVDKNSAKIYAIRYGAGEDREIPFSKTIPGEDTPKYTNQIPLSTDASGALYNNGQGWKANTRLNSSGAEASYTGVEVIGFIPAKSGDTIRFANITCDVTSSSTYKQQQYLTWYDSDKNKLDSSLLNGYETYFCSSDGYAGEVDENNNPKRLYLGTWFTSFCTGKGFDVADVAYFRISAEEIDNTSIITVNEEIV